MEEEDHFTQTLLPTLIAAFATAAMAAALLPLQLSTFSLYSSHSHTSLTLHTLALSLHSLYLSRFYSVFCLHEKGKHKYSGCKGEGGW